MYPRPFPHYNVGYDQNERKLAKALRKEFIPKITRRLHGHHLCGHPHDFIVKYVANQKKHYPFFIRTDIEKFYPSIEHRDLIVNMQMAYKELLSLNYVPSSFRKKYVPIVNKWCKELPLTRGIPLGSPLSAILAPVMLLPLWLQIKKMFNVPMIVFMDDVLIFAKDREQMTDIYVFLENELSMNYHLKLNLNKTNTGRFAAKSFDFCGWEFTGGYVRIKQSKMDAFLKRINEEHTRCNRSNFRSYIKRINRKIIGFGHYYKFGDVKKQFETLDTEVRKLIRQRLKREGTMYANNALLTGIGFKSLSAIKKILSTNKDICKKDDAQHFLSSTKANRIQISRSGSLASSAVPPEIAEKHLLLLEKISRQLSQLTTLNRKLLRITEESFRPILDIM